ncbi:hypothetical protein [Leuconostoc citreum]|uniref:hypothetical protein n=1 Tax=Leuconostoc citreum TaxID=33964 RepID=UPI0029587712|nr:hypothetical protein [Leuconostoc citreum]MDV8931179.1 hypothetical protein [Leuconostoc citreum]
MEFLKQPSFWFALISAVAATYTVVNSYMTNHRKPTININWVSEMEIGSQITISFFINNPSVRSVSITDIKLLFGTREYSATKYPNRLVGSEKIAYSDSLPININPYQSESFIVPFQFLPNDVFGKSNIDFAFSIGTKQMRNSFFIAQKHKTPEQVVLILDQQLQQ